MNQRVRQYGSKRKKGMIHVKDTNLEQRWKELGDIPIDDADCITEPFYEWKVGTFREQIWHWFDNHHSKGVVWLIFQRGEQ
jgi:hypothetical protein